MQQVCSTNLIRNFGISLLALNAQSANALPFDFQRVDWSCVWPANDHPVEVEITRAKFDSGIRTARFALEMAKKLQDGWEGPGTYAPRMSALVLADSFLLTLGSQSRPPEISIGSDGEVNLSWRTTDTFIDLSFYDDRGGILYARVNGEKFRRLPPIKAFEQLPEIVRSATLRA